jgi:uncharacterized protein DUF2834
MSVAAPGRMFGIYAMLAFAGAILPYVLFIPWLADHGMDGRVFLAQLFATGPATIFAADVLFAAIVFLVFVWSEGRRLGMRHLWIQPVVTYGIGLCCALPLFLALRERHLARAA